MDRPTLEKCLVETKARYAAELAARLASDAVLAQRMPQAFRDTIVALRGLT